MKSLVCSLGILLIAAVLCSARGYDGVPEDAVIVPLGELGSGYEELEPGTPGGRLKTSLLYEPSSWNPILASDGKTAYCTGQMHRGLLSTHPITGALLPELAKAWEISDDGLTITLQLRKAIRWSDGEPFDADDVLFTFNDLILNEEVDATDLDSLRLPDGSFPMIRKIDAYTVEVVLSVPFRPILSALGASIVPEHRLASRVAKRNPDLPAGTFDATWGLDVHPNDLAGMGPFVLTTYVVGQYALMSRNPYYHHFDAHGVQLPYVDELLISFVYDKSVALLRFLNGELHLIDAEVADIPVLYAKAETRGFTIRVAKEGTGYSFLMLNQDTENENLRSLFRKLEFRQAVAYASDAEAKIAYSHGFADDVWSPISMASPYYGGRDGYGGPITEEDAVLYEYDLAEAARLLDMCGILDTNQDGIREFADETPVAFELLSVAGFEFAEMASIMMKQDLRRLGIDVHVNLTDFRSVASRFFQGQWDVTGLMMTGGGDPHGEVSILRTTHSLHAWHRSAATDDATPVEQEIDRLIDHAAGIYDPDEAFEVYKQIQLLFAREDLGMFFGVNPRIVIAAYDIVGNHAATRGPVTPIRTPYDLLFLREDS